MTKPKLYLYQNRTAHIQALTHAITSMSRSERTGKIERLILLGLILAVQLYITTSYVLNIGTDKLTDLLIKWLIIGTLCGLTFIKTHTAKWFLIAWFAFNIATATVKLNFIANYWLVGLTLFLCHTSFYLLFFHKI